MGLLLRFGCMLALSLAACSSDPNDEPAGGGTSGTEGGRAGSSTTGGAGPSTAGSSGGGAPSPTAGSGGGGGALAGQDAPAPLAGTTAPDPIDAGTTPDAATPTAGPNVDRSHPSLHDLAIEPQDLDPSTVDSLETEFAVLDTGVEPLGKLVIFLGGFTNPPGAWHDHGIELAGFGFHVVLPAYNNRWEDCNGPDCNANNRWEALVGEDVSSDIVASRADSAEGRVVAILQHLVDDDPGGDWGYYLDGPQRDQLRYEDIIIAGISHGAASSGLYASRRPFYRAVMHSGGWGDPGDAPRTPLTVWYGLAHTDDPDFDPIAGSWDDAGMLGERASIDGQSAPYGDAHKLITSEANSYPHCSVAVHESSPMSGGAYVFEPAWRYLYGVAELSH